MKDKHAFVDYVSWLQETPFWIPEPEAVVDKANEQYLGMWPWEEKLPPLIFPKPFNFSHHSAHLSKKKL